MLFHRHQVGVLLVRILVRVSTYIQKKKKCLGPENTPNSAISTVATNSLLVCNKAMILRIPALRDSKSFTKYGFAQKLLGTFSSFLFLCNL